MSFGVALKVFGATLNGFGATLNGFGATLNLRNIIKPMVFPSKNLVLHPLGFVLQWVSARKGSRGEALERTSGDYQRGVPK